MSVPLVVVIDPPWLFSDKLPGPSRGAERNYACMRPGEVARLLGDTIAHEPHVVAFCWRVAAMQREALSLLNDCDLTIKTELVWEKLTKTGKPWFGLGRYVRASHEVCLIATRGRAFPEVRNVRSRFAAPVREHSRKPDQFYAIVEAMYPNSRKIELFARQRRVGWESHGDQLDRFTQETV
jgi:N6-adenosine-specific RNA methylase IME4